MDEGTIQHNYVMEYLCRREDEGGLGYREVSHNVVSNDVFIPSLLAEFVSNSVPKTWSRLLSKYDGNEQALQEALQTAVRTRMLQYQNVAIFLNKNRSINFEGEQVPLYFVSGSELVGDEDFKKNIFAAVEESSHTIKTQAGVKLYTIRPDISFYLNGIFIGYMELKSVSMGQNAAEHGRGKVVKDYLSTIKALCEQEKINPKVEKERTEVLAIYEKAIHLVASDTNETYVLRGVAQFYDATHTEMMSDTPRTVEEIAPDVVKVFKPYPASTNLTQQQRFEEVARALYSKKMIENEILYYNFIENRYEKKDGKKTRTSHHGRLISPRPKQKFGCDKILARVTEMLDHESEPDYYTEKLRRELQALEIPAEKIEEIILTRESFCNNKYVYSLLMQYAAGFGKSNIIGWTALRLKDYRYKGEYAYNKIMLVVDRLQLRDQLDTMMMNMNIDKSMFIEATDKDTFIKALDSTKRIIVVNIQKFNDLKDAIDASGTKLKKMRVAFLIDEIHRSNSGKNNEQMIDLFARLQETFRKDGEIIERKNLLIGFTATPSDETLTRFGEFRSAYVVPLWVPFDSYTMKEAIEDGYILDPTKHIIPYSVPIGFDIPEELKDLPADEIVDIRETKARVYEHEPRMRKIAEFVVQRLVSLIYGKIRGEGKAMLAVSSIPIAIKYCHIIREMYAKKCEEPLYAKYKDAPIVIVYSDNQKNEACSTLNGGLTEAKVIEKFKGAKNGLIIVVDKLQTGFDEPKLHTLFLDKEIQGINAIQTISRVNRTTKYKTECHVIDCSWKNANVDNIKLAFKKFCGMTLSNFNPEEEAKEVARIYKDLRASNPYIGWFDRFKKEREDEQFALEMEDGIRRWILQCCAHEEAARKYNTEHELKPDDPDFRDETNRARDLRMLVGRYASSIRSLQDVLDIDPKYSDDTFLAFWAIYCKIYRDATKKPKGDNTYEYEVIDSDELPGITLVEETDPDDPATGKSKPGGDTTKPPLPKGKAMERILEILSRMNEEERLTAKQAQAWLDEIGKMFEFMAADEAFCAKVKDENFSEVEKLREYKKLQDQYRRMATARPDFLLKEEFKKMLNDNVEQLYAIFISELRNVEEQNSDFNYNTTDEQTDDGKKGDDDQLTMEQLIALAMKKVKPTYKESALKDAIAEKHNADFKDIAYGLRDFDEIIDNMFMVLNVPTKEELDGMGDMVKESLNMVCRAENMTLTEKRMHFNVLLMRYEVFLKKLYYLTHGKDVENEDGTKVTLGNAIYAIPSLRKLKYKDDAGYPAFYEYLTMVRKLRNDEAHGAVVVGEQELEAATRIVIDMYLFAVATNITELEMEGFYPEKYAQSEDDTEEAPEAVITKPITYGPAPKDIEDEIGEGYSLAAESKVQKMPEQKRVDLFRKCIMNFIGYDDAKKKFGKQHYWEAVYRIAADEGFVIDGDYDYFKYFIDQMDLEDLPNFTTSTINTLNQGIFAQHIDEWTADGLKGRKLQKFEDIHQFAQAFHAIVTEEINKK